MKKLLSAAVAAITLIHLSLPAFAGSIISPQANTNNTLTVGTSNTDRIRISFRADNDPEDFYFGTSTDWDDCAFAALFEGQDAYFYGITINKMIPAVTAPTLYLYNPFVDDDGEPIIPVSQVKIYEMEDGSLSDVTSSFTSVVDEDGNLMFAVRTRVPGSYILAEKAVDLEQAAELVQQTDKQEVRRVRKTFQAIT